MAVEARIDFLAESKTVNFARVLRFIALVTFFFTGLAEDLSSFLAGFGSYCRNLIMSTIQLVIYIDLTLYAFVLMPARFRFFPNSSS